MLTFNRILVFGFALTVVGLVADYASAATPRQGSTVVCSVVYINGDAVIACPAAPVVKVAR